MSYLEKRRHWQPSLRQPQTGGPSCYIIERIEIPRFLSVQLRLCMRDAVEPDPLNGRLLVFHAYRADWICSG